MSNDDDFTFCQVVSRVNTDSSGPQETVPNIAGSSIKEDFPNGASGNHKDGFLRRDKPLDNATSDKQGTVGSLSYNVIDMSAPNQLSESSKQKALEHAGDLGKGSQGTVGSLSFNVIDMSPPNQLSESSKQRALENGDLGKDSQGTVDSLSFNVIDMSTPKKLSESSKQKTAIKKPAARNKVPFEKGYSQMDWLKLTRTHPDLAGIKGQSNKRLVSMDEVKQHQQEGSIWTVLKGRVYNISPYMKFHPGGVDMLMKAAGKDCTSLFNKYHAWVNAEFLLEKCLVGTLDG